MGINLHKIVSTILIKHALYNRIVLYKTLMEHNDETKRVQVSFTQEQWELIENLKGNMGKSDADAVRNIVISWLAEKSFISTTVKEEMKDE